MARFLKNHKNGHTVISDILIIARSPHKKYDPNTHCQVAFSSWFGMLFYHVI